MAELFAEKVFDALGDATRRKIILLLGPPGPKPISELHKHLEITLAGVVQHIRILESCKLIITKKTYFSVLTAETT